MAGRLRSRSHGLKLRIMERGKLFWVLRRHTWDEFCSDVHMGKCVKANHKGVSEVAE